jgi:lipopolysaccharide transport system ATP-binding protein
MTDVAIRVEGIGKLYRVGERETALRDVLAGAFRSRRNGRARPKDSIWAVRDVSFEVRQGEVVGLIGRNGAGKSTLLKLLARITRPTVGGAQLHGRIGSLLEVGTGFHPELTGRENIFLSGAILGMKKAEIRRKFDEIVAFAEVERFLDSPLKHYSSGMQMRLAFAVAAHLEPEILLVDEVLAVGDLQFQKKCLGKMQDVSRTGRTIIFVSHNMAQIRRLCQRVIWVDGGKIRIDGPTHKVVGSYESAMSRGSRNGNETKRAESLETRFVSWEITGGNSANPHSLDHLNPLTIRIVADVRRRIPKGGHGIALYDHDQKLVWSKAPQKLALGTGEHSFYHTFPMLPLRPGLYTWVVTLLDDDQVIDSWNCEPEMMVAAENHQTPFDEWMGVLNIPSSFDAKIESLQSSPQASTSESPTNASVLPTSRKVSI